MLSCALFATSPVLAASEAEQLVRAGDLSAAWEAAVAQAKADPDDLDAQELRIDLAFALELRDLVLPELRALSRAQPDKPGPHYLLGRIALEASEAEAHYTKALELEPGHARSHMGIAAVRRAQGDLSAAAAAYRRALEADPSLSEAWAGLQAALLQQSDFEGAIQVSNDALRLVPDDPDTYIAAATIQPERALDILLVGARRIDDDPRLYAVLARAHLDAGQGEQALRRAKQALTITPGFSEAGYLALVAREMVGDRLDPSGWADLQAAQRLDAADEARRAFDRLVDRYPTSALAWLGRGKVRAESGELEASLRDFARAVSLARDEPEVLANHGLALLQAGRPDEALPSLKRASTERPADVSLGIAVVRAATGAGQPQLARELAVGLVQRHPQDLRAIFHTAQLLSAQGDSEAAYLLLRESLPRQPDPRLIVALAAAARDAGYYAEAAEILERLAKLFDLPKAQEIADQLKREAASGAAGSKP